MNALKPKLTVKISADTLFDGSGADPQENAGQGGTSQDHSHTGNSDSPAIFIGDDRMHQPLPSEYLSD
jgi:hypothetical protein